MPDRETIEAEAAAWVAQLDGAEPSNEDLAALREWMARSPQHRAAIERLSAVWDDLNLLTQLAVPLPAVSVEDRRVVTRFLSGTRRPALAGAIAGALVLGFVAGISSWRDAGPAPSVSAGKPADVAGQELSYATAVGEQRTLDLADGSRITLNTDSEVAVDIGAASREIRLLRGEALFEVAHDPHRPFMVFAGNGLVRAVGTAFSVYLKDPDNVSVTVAEGEVELATVPVPETNRPDSGGEVPSAPLVTIKAGQSATFGRGIESIKSLAQAEIERRLSWREGMLRFHGEPLSRVVLEVSRYTTQKIVILDPALRDLRVGGYFKVGETEAMFEALETSFGVRVQRISADLVHLSGAN